MIRKILSMIERRLSTTLVKRLHDNKAILIFGARQTGKTTLLKMMFPPDNQTLWLYGDNRETHQMLADRSASRYKTLFAKYHIIVIDEAQYINEIGRILKIFTDQLPNIKVVATGSSAFDLANKTAEPLTGRKWEYQLYPLSFAEMCNFHGIVEETNLLPHRLVYGYYPEVVTQNGNEREILKTIANSYLYKDLLAWSNIQHADMLVKLLQYLALQLGNEVSYLELSRQLGIDRGTVERYIDLLEKTFVIFRLGSYSRNHRAELKKAKKIYFHDVGIRNALISNFSPLDLREDAGVLWENFLIAERKKMNDYENLWTNVFFWRTAAQAEIDYIEERDGRLYAYEFKWNPRKTGKSAPRSFMSAYPKATFELISRDNFQAFLQK